MYANRRKQKHEKDTTRKASETYKHARLQKKYNLQPAIPDKDYGPLATTPSNTSQSELYDICKEYLKSLQVTEARAAELAKSTADQDPSPNSLWQRLRSVRLTASKFGSIVKRQSKFEKLVETIHYKLLPGAVAALEWGRSHEDTARDAYINSKMSIKTYQVHHTGVHISTEHPWLAASPDELVEDPSEVDGRNQGILEIKCPYSARTLTPEAACQDINRFCSNIEYGHIALKKQHNYYYQVQGQLAITKRPWCDFVFGLLMEYQWRELLEITHFGKPKWFLN